MKSLREQFVDWVRTKPANEEYDFTKSDLCAFAQFGEFMGVPALVGPPGTQKIWEMGLEDVLAGSPQTFGALAHRLSSPKQEV